MEPMTISEAMEFLGVSDRTVRRLIKRGSIDAKKFNNSWMLDRASVENYQSRNEGKDPNDPTRG